MAKQKIIKTGNSLAVTIPSDFVKTVGIRAGQEAEVKTDPGTGQVVCTFSGAKQLPLAQGFIKKRTKK